MGKRGQGRSKKGRSKGASRGTCKENRGKTHVGLRSENGWASFQEPQMPAEGIQFIVQTLLNLPFLPRVVGEVELIVTAGSFWWAPELAARAVLTALAGTGYIRPRILFLVQCWGLSSWQAGAQPLCL